MPQGDRIQPKFIGNLFSGCFKLAFFVQINKDSLDQR